MGKKFSNILDKKKRGSNDDRYWRPREKEIRVSNFEGYGKVFGWTHKINGKYYFEKDGKFIEVKK